MDEYDRPALCYPRYRGPSTRNRIPTGLKIIRRINEKLQKQNYPEVDENKYYIYKFINFSEKFCTYKDSVYGYFFF